MKKIVCLFAFASALLVSCNYGDDDPVTINGTWKLATIQGAPAVLAGVSGTIIVRGSAHYSLTLHIPDFGKAVSTGTVTAVSETQYTFTPADYAAFTADLSSDGKTLAYTDILLGDVTFKK